MESSAYQKAIFKHLESYGGNSAVISVAGSGKTWTAIEGVGFVSRAYSVLMGAFNVSIRDEFKDRLAKKGHNHVKTVNYNGFGWGICLKNMVRKPELDENKTDNVLEFIVMKGDDRLGRFMSPVRRLVSLLKSYNIHDAQEASDRLIEIVDYHNLDVPNDKDFYTIAIETFNACNEHMEHFDFDDQKYMPLHLGFPIPRYDLVVLDEFQDTCPVEWALMSQAGEQICAIGDPDQTIYGFKGANPDMFPDFIKNYNAKELPLSICYRCPWKIVDLAKQIVPRIEAAPGAIAGDVDEISTKNFHDRVQQKQFVLCRTTEPLVKHCLRDIRAGKKAKVRGRDFGGALEYIIDKVSGRKDMPIADFMTALIDYQLLRIQQLKEQRRPNEILAFEDRVNTLRALADGCSSTEGIKAQGKAVFTDQPHEGVDYMTIHKSKGLQNATVWWLRPDLCPHPAAQRPWMQAEERRLQYVGITRSTNQLFYIQKEPNER